jgi:signal transduction histidine kinase/CheY-like chemotaxis protein
MLDFFRRPYVLALSSFAWSSGIFAVCSLLTALGLLLRQVLSAANARRSAIQANAARSEFLANMSHELRTPLNGIFGAAELMAHTVLSPEQRELTAIMKSSAESLVSIVDAIFDFSRIESGGIVVQAVEFDVRVSIDTVVESFTLQARAKGLALQSSVAADVPATLVGDPERIRQILVNLVDNALKFTTAGSVKVEVSQTGDLGENRGILFRVIDTGIGVHPRIAARIFRPFTQGDSSTTRRYGGTGLGLAISHRLVALMGGAIEVESRPGRGSTFWFLLPLVQAKPALAMSGAATQAQSGAANAPGERVLIVDDNPVNQMVALRAVKNLGYIAEVATGGEQALQAIALVEFAAVLMDCQMPGIDGYQATTQIRKRAAEGGSTRRIPIIAMTASVTEGDPERCRAAGMDDYLTKPLRMATLSAVLERWTHGPAAIGARSANPVPASTTLPDPASGHLPIPLPGEPLRGEIPTYAG